ncbi:hypothetical protein [Haloechinothrix salitolerans]|uniref:Uncharacterized protein n=1 Tax=Haloechinothrix salitolerans TaxID=926830 RepID=A0ABW2BS45_9PSEU
MTISSRGYFIMNAIAMRAFPLYPPRVGFRSGKNPDDFVGGRPYYDVGVSGSGAEFDTRSFVARAVGAVFVSSGNTSSRWCVLGERLS